MTTTDTHDLIVNAIWNAANGRPIPFNPDDLAAAVLPIVAEEVRKAKAEALREMQEHHEREADKAQTIAARGIHLTIADGARTRAAEYETGASDEHR